MRLSRRASERAVVEEWSVIAENWDAAAEGGGGGDNRVGGVGDGRSSC